jgi:hypothetical protein
LVIQTIKNSSTLSSNSTSPSINSSFFQTMLSRLPIKTYKNG